MDGLKAVPFNRNEFFRSLFSRAAELWPVRALAPEVRFSTPVHARGQREKTVSQRLKPSLAEGNYGTAEAVPFVVRVLPQPLSGRGFSLRHDDCN
jgi:hypothetical protein